LRLFDNDGTTSQLNEQADDRKHTDKATPPLPPQKTSGIMSTTKANPTKKFAEDAPEIRQAFAPNFAKEMLSAFFSASAVP
jgi:hypothetical protein